MPADPTRPPVPLDRIEAKFKDAAERRRAWTHVDPEDGVALTAALRLARGHIEWCCEEHDAREGRRVLAALDAAVSFSPTGGAENEA